MTEGADMACLQMESLRDNSTRYQDRVQLQLDNTGVNGARRSQSDLLVCRLSLGSTLVAVCRIVPAVDLENIE